MTQRIPTLAATLLAMLIAPAPAALALQFPADIPALGARLMAPVSMESPTDTPGLLRMRAAYQITQGAQAPTTQHFTLEFQVAHGGVSSSTSHGQTFSPTLVRFRKERRSADGTLLSGIDANYIQGQASFLGEDAVRASGPLAPAKLTAKTLSPEGRPTIATMGDVFDFQPELNIPTRHKP